MRFGEAILLAVALFWSAAAAADELTGQPLAGLLRGSLQADSSSATIQPALGRAMSELADLYMARRIGRPAVEQLMSRYQDMLRTAGPDTIIAVAVPTPVVEAVTEAPDTGLVYMLYEGAVSYGYATAWIGVGTLFLEEPLAGESKAAEKAFSAFSRAAALGNSEAQLRVAELSILGVGTAQDVAGGTAVLQGLAKADESPRVLMALATLCLSGRIPLQPDLALAALHRAAGLGSADADLRLGDLYSRGEDVDNNDALALAHYKSASARGLKDGDVRLAEMQARGQGVQKDVDVALAALDALAKSGQTSALIALGDLYATGEVLRAEPARARDFYAAAADGGSEEGLRLLGDGYQAGWFGPRSDTHAAKFYRRAMEAGTPGGLLALGRLEASSPKKSVATRGIALLRQAVEAKTDGAVSALAEATFYGHGTKQAPAAALALLEGAAAAGERQALLSLVSAFRDGKADGRVLLVRKDARKAKALIASAADRLPAPEMRIQRFLLDASTANAKAFASLNDRFMTLARPERMSVFRDLPAVNQNLYVWIAKDRLSAMGAFSGKIDGHLDRPFIEAAVSYCRKMLSNRQCYQGPFGRDIARLLAYAL